jgi:RNA polymerase-binding transcription factor DksA
LVRHATITAMINTKHFKEKLETEKKLLEEELGAIALFNTETNMWEATPDQDMIGEIDDNDAADRFEDFEERTSMVTTLQARLMDVNAALKKIEDKTFGKCEISGEPIEIDRLEANPAARTNKAHMNG